MAQRNVMECDVCGKETSPKNRIAIDVDRQMDAAGDMDDIVEVIDLCEKHLRDGLSICLSAIPRNQRAYYIKKVKQLKTDHIRKIISEINRNE